MTQFTILHGLLSGITYLIIINALILIVVLYTQASQQLNVAVEIACVLECLPGLTQSHKSSCEL